MVTVTERWTFVFADEGVAPAHVHHQLACARTTSPLDVDVSALPTGGAENTAPSSTATPAADPTAGDDAV